jgi:hypothetical protein
MMAWADAIIIGFLISFIGVLLAGQLGVFAP